MPTDKPPGPEPRQVTPEPASWLERFDSRLHLGPVGLPLFSLALALGAEVDPLTFLLSAKGLAAGGGALLSSLSSIAGSRKMRRFYEGVLADLGPEMRMQAARITEEAIAREAADERLQGRIDEVADDAAERISDLDLRTRALEAEAAAFGSRVDDVQLEQIGVIVEDVVRTLDEKRLAMLARAAAGVARGDLDADTRHAVLANLSAIGPSHVQALRRIPLTGTTMDTGRDWFRSLPLGQSRIRPTLGATHAALVAVGFAELRPSTTTREVKVGRSNAPKSTRTETRLRLHRTSLGIAALKLLDDTRRAPGGEPDEPPASEA